MGQLIMGFIMISVVIVVFVLVVELIKVLLPVLALIVVALSVAGVAVWISGSDPSARREKRQSNVADNRRVPRAKAAARQKSRKERRASAQRNESLQKLRAKDREVAFILDLVDVSFVPFPNEKPIEYFGRKLNWCLFNADARAIMIQELATLESGGPTGSNGDADIIEHLNWLSNIEEVTRQRGANLTFPLAHPASNDTVNAKITQDNVIERLQMNPQGSSINEPPFKSVDEARFSLLSTLEGITEAKRIRVVGDPLGASYEKLRWALNKKQARILIDDARNLIGRSEKLGSSSHSEKNALACEMREAEVQLWDYVTKIRRA